jgi:hypothetical protein
MGETGLINLGSATVDDFNSIALVGLFGKKIG